MATLERREHRRVSFDIDIREEQLRGTQTARAIDLCELGMRYTKPLSARHDQQREVLLRFDLAGEPVTVLGWVASQRIHAGERETSVTFTCMQPDEEERLRRYVASRR